MEKYTKGPYYTQKTGNHQRVIASEATGESIAVVYDAKNAPLLEAAPELLEALEELVAEWDNEHQDESHQTGITPETHGLILARAAISKALGKGD